MAEPLRQLKVFHPTLQLQYFDICCTAYGPMNGFWVN